MAKRKIITYDKSGLTDRQIAHLNRRAQSPDFSSKSLGALAGQFRQKNSVDPKIGSAGEFTDPAKTVTDVTGAATGDTETGFKLNNPSSQTDVYGNKQDISKDANGNVSINQTGGQSTDAIIKALLGALQNFGANGQSGRQNAQDSAYNYITKNYGTQKSQEMEQAKQELANKGIPLDPTPGSLYSKTLKQIDDKYQGMDDQAKNLGLTAGNQYYQTDVAGINTLANTAKSVGGDFTNYAGGQSEQLKALLAAFGLVSTGNTNATNAQTGANQPIVGGVAP